jgi:hypothetical protein
MTNAEFSTARIFRLRTSPHMEASTRATPAAQKRSPTCDVLATADREMMRVDKRKIKLARVRGSSATMVRFSTCFRPEPSFIKITDNIYYTNGLACCQYAIVGPYTGGPVTRIRTSMKNVGLCSPAVPTGWFC